MIRDLTRRQILELALAGAAGAALPFGCSAREEVGLDPDADQQSAGPDAGASRRPHVVYVYFDQLRGDMIGSAGHHPALRTPTLDRIAAESVRFSRCFTSSALCRPARASMMTGLLPRHHGVIGHTTSQLADPAGPSHVRDAREAGYHTAVVGKTHLHGGDGTGGGHLDDYQDVLRAWGFDTIVELTGPSESVRIRSAWSDAIGEPAYQAFRSYMADYEERAKHCEPGTPAELAADPLAGAGQWRTRAPDRFSPLLDRDNHLDVWCARRAAELIRDHDATAPLYLQINFPGPHSPYDATERYRAELVDALDSIPTGPLSLPNGPSSPIIQGSLAYLGRCATPEQIRQLRALYYAKVTMLDEALAEVVDAMAARGWLDDAWLVVSADHGDMLGSHSLLGKLVFFEESIHIPLLVRPPGGVSARTTSVLADQLDVTETLRDIVGAPANREPGSPERGTSLLGAISDATWTGKPAVIVEDLGFASIRTTDRKLVYHYLDVFTGERVNRPVELYDLGSDPEETVNRIADPAYQGDVAALIEGLRGMA